MLLIGKILLSVLAVFGLYVLLHRLFSVEKEIVLAVRISAEATEEERLHLIARARDDAWLCGRRVILLEDGTERETIRKH